MKNIRLRNYLILAYVLALTVGFFYVKSVLDYNVIKEAVKKDKKTQEVKPVKVYLTLQDATTFNARLQNIDTVGDLLNRLRTDDKLFFERTRYIYGTEINDVNHVKTPEGYEWKVFLKNVDITKDIDDTKLVDENVYELKLVKM